MKNYTSILLYLLIWFWFSCIAFIQSLHPFTMQITIAAVILYALLYAVIHAAARGTIRTFLALGAFTITFSIFWTNIIYLVFFIADLLPGVNPLSMVLTALIHAQLYILFYRFLEKKHQTDTIRTRSTLHFILEITFPLLISTGLFTGALLLYSQLQENGLAFYSDGLTVLITLVTVTITGTVLAVSLFETWLQKAEKRSMEKVLVGLMVAGILFTILLVRSNL